MLGIVAEPTRAGHARHNRTPHHSGEKNGPTSGNPYHEVLDCTPQTAVHPGSIEAGAAHNRALAL
jgi:hypothetical protein